MEPITIGVLAVGVGAGALALRARAKAKAAAAATTTPGQPTAATINAAAAAAGVPASAVAQGLTPSTIAAGITPAQVAANVASLQQSIQAGLANGTVVLGANGVPFQATAPFDPSKTPAALLKPDGTLDLLVTDLITVNNDLLAGSLVTGASNVPGFQPGENILMSVAQILDPRVGPIMAVSQDTRLVLTAPIPIQPNMITGVQPSDAATLEKGLAAIRK